MLIRNNKEITDKTIYITNIYLKDDGKYDCKCWAGNGGTVIAGGIYSDVKEFENDETIAKANFENGLIKCADCGKLVKYEDIRNNRFFAGLYCDECWEREWKEVEANETYN